jgi:hypothetical protein
LYKAESTNSKEQEKIIGSYIMEYKYSRVQEKRLNACIQHSTQIQETKTKI